MSNMMQRRHFELIANALRNTRGPFLGQTGAEQHHARVQWQKTVAEFAHRLKATNPGFDRERFLKACGVDE